MSAFIKKNIPITVRSSSNNPFLSLQNELNKVMDDFYGWSEPFNFPVERFESLSLLPAMDFVEDKESIKIECEMPGMGAEDVKVHIDNGTLTIEGEKTISKQDKDKQYRSREISYGSYKRSLSLPKDVDVSQAKASFKKGMLWIKIPKKPESREQHQELKIEAVQ